MPKNDERPFYADGMVGFIRDQQVTHSQMIESKYRWISHCSEAGLRARLTKLASMGILERVETGPRSVEYKVSQKEKDRCLNLAQEADKDCKEWTQGLFQ